MRRLAFVWLAVAPLLVLVSIWLPVWQHYRVPDLTVNTVLIDTLRVRPTDARLLNLDRQAQGLRVSLPDSDVMHQADAISQGRIALTTGEIRRTTLPFDARDYDGGTPGGALNMASLIVVDTLLRAHELTGNEAYFAHARQTILGFIEFERTLSTDIGNVRNDHAIAARVGVLIRFWRVYRTRADFDETVARAVVQHVARCAVYLGMDSHFTAGTNHGVMQNIALLQAATAFPTLPDVSAWRDTARSRLRQQMAFFTNAEGVVLEHGPGYHEFGTALMGMVLELLDWNGLPGIDDMAQKHALGAAFLDRLQRPDGSIPRVGDTDGEIVPIGVASRQHPIPEVVADPSLPLRDSTYVYPSAGYAITRRSLALPTETGLGVSHAMVYWSHFPGHGHEVAAEGSFLLWAAGTDWVGNTGYWPYGLAGRTAATGWRGSNAPHVLGESATSVRKTALLTYAADARRHLLDLARSIDHGPRLRRQVVQIDERTWLVLDSHSAPLTETVDRLWTLAPHLAVEDIGPGNGMVAKDPATGWRLRIDFLGDPPLAVRRMRGSLEPFGGWVMNGPQPMPSQSYEIRQEPGSRWTAAVFSLVPPGVEPGSPNTVIHYNAEDDWSVSVKAGGLRSIDVQRRRDRLLVAEGGATTRYIGLETPSINSMAERATIQEALAGTLREFHRFQPHVFYRLRLSYAVGVAALTILGAWVWTRRFAGRLPLLVSTLGLIFWPAAAAWIHLVYLAA